MNVSFHFSWVNTQEWNGWVTCSCMLNFVRNCQTVSEWRFHFAFPVAKHDSPTFSPALDIVHIFYSSQFKVCVLVPHSTPYFLSLE